MKKNSRRNSFPWAKWGTIAACFALLFVLDTDTETQKQMQDYAAKVEYQTQQATKETLQNVESESFVGSDMPIPENPGSTGALVSYDEVWGGSYMNDAGQWVVWLTENTAETQKRVLELNPTLEKDDVIFKTATYSQDYLTDLMKTMSQAVGNSKEFLFVSSIGLREEKNCIDVYVTTSDSEKLAKLLEFDTVGGAIEIVYLDNSSDVPEESRKEAPADQNGMYMEAVESEDLSKDEAEFFGGSYLDSSGKFVIVLTEDTPENRTVICKKLGVSEGNTTFQKGEYTLAYLTELQAKISNAMINKEMPFVVTSSVSETINRIKVGVTTDDDAELAKVYALDSIGGAIVIEKSAGVATKDLLVPKAELEE